MSAWCMAHPWMTFGIVLFVLPWLVRLGIVVSVFAMTFVIAGIAAICSAVRR